MRLLRKKWPGDEASGEGEKKGVHEIVRRRFWGFEII